MSRGWLRFRDLPLRRKLSLLMALAAAVALVFSAVPLIAYAWIKARDSARLDLDSLSHITADSATAALAFNDERTASEIVAALRSKPDVEHACLYRLTLEGTAELMARYEPSGAGSCPPQPGAAGLHEELEFLTMVRPVDESGDQIGWLRIRQNLRALRGALAAQVGITLAILGISFAASILIAISMQRVLADPLLRLASVARHVSESRNYGLRAEKTGEDEVGQLIDDFNDMLEQIALRESQLQRAQQALEVQVREKTAANLELEGALLHLKEAQAQLVQNERLASLGALVAGVAHEINTPVGIGVTAASTLLERAVRLRKAYESDELKRSDLERFVAIATESSEIILKNLQRAADLIHSFKQVAVDQTSGERRHFAMKTYIDEVLLSLAPKLRKSGHSVEVSCPPDLSVDSYPGAIAQILTNLVSNSLLHAYDEGARGRMRIEVKDAGGWITLRYTDDGRGIPREHLGRIYDPFFTTRRGAGGSGLGLHIVYNLVTQMLGGTIEVKSEPGQGVEFIIGFPPVTRRAAA